MLNKTVNHVSATRQRLELMHIDLWALREQATQIVTSSVWRDQLTADDQAAENNQSQVITVESSTGCADVPFEKQTLAVNESFHIEQSKQTQREAAIKAPSTAIREIPVERHLAKANIDDQRFNVQMTQEQNTDNHRDSELSTARFEWQFCILPQVVLLVDATAWLQLMPDADSATAISAQQSLWQNIILGLHAQNLPLMWPPVIQQWQEQRGQSAYVAGFLAAYAQHNNIIVLGQMPAQHKAILQQSFDQELIEMPSLAEMLRDWRCKQKLWLKIREYNRRDLAQD